MATVRSVLTRFLPKTNQRQFQVYWLFLQILNHFILRFVLYRGNRHALLTICRILSLLADSELAGAVLYQNHIRFPLGMRNSNLKSIKKYFNPDIFS